MSEKLRVLVADDSTVFRKIVRDSLASIPGVEIVGHAVNGADALRCLTELKPDLVTLDIEMPEMDGLDVLRQIKSLGLDTAAIMVSSLTSTGARATTQALALGAFDLILKPSGSDLQENVSLLRSEFEPKIKALQKSRLQPKTISADTCTVGQVSRKRDAKPHVSDGDALDNQSGGGIPEIAVIGTSTGGPAALTRVLPMLPADFPLPILIVQHMPAMFTKTLADDLDRQCKLNVREAAGGERIKAGDVFIAPGGRHMKVVRTSTGVFLRVTEDAPVLSCRPSVDYMFRSVSGAYEKILAVIMTGMGDDGSRSIDEMDSDSVTVIAQDEATCTVYGMPRCIVEKGNANIVCPVDSIAGAMVRVTTKETSQKGHVASCN